MDCAECVATIDYSIRESITQLPSNPELMDTKCAGLLQDHLKHTKTDDMSKEEQQARINCEGLGHSTEQLENHRRLCLQMKETYHSVVKILPKDDACNTMLARN
ncbi:hypothetical protein CEXT_63921 [Caerostris extrusa]|uniref:Uncharacterized protein n=1 Tax=Caerostris extrusa TaxID=172846 RepID=A0AAV4VII8_CAEEX|nr:hypothetical protein CEXT_63921 [Caerostris extrusa]